VGERSQIEYDVRFEEYLVARWAGYTDEAFQRLSADKRAKHIVAYRQYHRMQAAEARAQAKRGGAK